VEPVDEIRGLITEYKDKFRNDCAEINILLNTYLRDGKTLLYIACKEGKLDIVKYFLTLNINTNVKSYLGEKEFETPIQVACRWNYFKIVEVLLKNGKHSVHDIKQCLKLTQSKDVQDILNNYIKNKKSFSCCY
jgi:ankyrin repeat protein